MKNLISGAVFVLAMAVVGLTIIHDNELNDMNAKIASQNNEIQNLQKQVKSLIDKERSQNNTITEMSKNLTYASKSIEWARSGTGFQSISYNVAWSHAYIPHVYNCADFSNDLYKALTNAGWRARTQFGRLYDGRPCDSEYACRHEWVIVEVPIEATTGEVIPPDVYKSQYVESLV